MKKSNWLVSLVFLAISSTALADRAANGWQNGVNLNGLGTNGVSKNGLGTNGITKNGFGVDNTSATRPAIVLSGVRGGAATADHQVHLTGIRLKKH